jgi:hypothetical protein
LETARQSLQDLQSQTETLRQHRNEALLRDDDPQASRLQGRTEGLERASRTAAEKVRLLEQVAEKEAASAAARERQEKIDRIELLFRERDEVGGRLAALVAEADATFVRALSIGQEISSLWPWRRDELGATLCSTGAMTVALQNEIYRHARPAPGGGLEHLAPPSFPGGVPGDFMWMMVPEKSAAPLVDRLAGATAAAGIILRTGRNDAVPDPVPIVLPASPDASAEPAPAPCDAAPPPGAINGHSEPKDAPPPPNPELSRLLAELDALVSKPMGPVEDAKYESLSRRVKQLS